MCEVMSGGANVLLLLMLQDTAAWRDAIYATDFQSKVCLIISY